VNWLVYLAAIAAGAANPAQSGTNAELRKQLGQTVLPTIAVYVTGLAGMLLIQLFVREAWPAADKLAKTPWWAWMGGLLSIVSTVAGVTLAQRMGSGVFTTLSVTAAIISSVVIDNFGWIGFKEHPASIPRVLGCALMIGGLWLVAKF
jgi:transporter family-2 protein